MNWVDAILIVIVLASVIIGSKKGLIRELMAFVVFFTAVVIAVIYVDGFAIWVYDQLGGSPLISAFLSFAILIAASYASFKLVGMLFFKIADLKQSGKRDQMGGAMIGFLRGWVAIGFITLLTFLLPLPQMYYESFETSFFGPTVAKTIPLMFEGTSKLHPQTPSFMDQMERTLLEAPSDSNTGFESDEHRQQVFKVLFQIERFFNTTGNET